MEREIEPHSFDLFLLIIDDRHSDTHVEVYSSIEQADRALNRHKRAYTKAYAPGIALRWKDQPVAGWERHWVTHDDGPSMSVRKTKLDPKPE